MSILTKQWCIIFRIACQAGSAVLTLRTDGASYTEKYQDYTYYSHNDLIACMGCSKQL